MNKLLLSVCILLTGCVGRFVKVANTVVPKTTDFKITTVVATLSFHEEEGKLIIGKATETIHVGCSGVFISPRGHILSCAHCFEVGKNESIFVTLSNGERTEAELLYKDHDKDLALLKIDVIRPVPYATLADYRSIKVGEEVLAVGSPLGSPFSVTHGIISAIHRDEADLDDSIQSDAFINPGNSGGPLFNLDGELIGINSRIIPPVPAPIFTGLGFSVAPSQIEEFLNLFRGL